MKLVRFRTDGDEQARPGVAMDGQVFDLADAKFRSGSAPDLGTVLQEVGEYGPATVLSATEDAETFDRGEVALAPPIPGAGRLICLGGAYTSHLRAQGHNLTTVPSQWVMPETAIVGPGEPIRLTERVVEETLPAVELGAVIGRGGRFIGGTEAYDHLAGFTIVNDVTARTDWPGPMGYKMMDTFSPCGPHVVTADEVANPHDLDLEIRQDDQVICAGSTQGLRFSLSFIVSYLSTILELRPGDVISTGDPAGVEDRLRPGSTVELEVEEVGVLRNPVVGPANR